MEQWMVIDTEHSNLSRNGHLSYSLLACGIVFFCTLLVQTSEPSGRRMRSVGLERDLPRNAKLYLSSTPWAAHDFNPASNPLSSFTHACQSPMTVAAVLKHLRVNSTTVVADDYAQECRSIINFHFDAGRLRMAERIYQRLPANAVNIITNDRPQWEGGTIHDDAEINSI